MTSTLPHVKAVIEALGGREKAASALSVRETAVGNWIVCNRLPAKRYFAIRDLVAPAVIPESLWAMSPSPLRPAHVRGKSSGVSA